jgi:hypothetical protein
MNFVNNKRMTRKQRALEKEQSSGANLKYTWVDLYRVVCSDKPDEIEMMKIAFTDGYFKTSLTTAVEAAFVNGFILLNDALEILTKNIGSDDAKKFEDKLWLLYPNLCDKNSGY